VRAVLLAGLLAAAGATSAELARLPADRLCVTRGRVVALPDGRVGILEPKMRAVVPGSDGNRAQLRFVYRGPTAEVARLGSGELRRQIGLKLRAQDGCNVLYVMWRIEPKAGIVVSLKRNPGQHTHLQCGNRGYRNLNGVVTQPATIAPGTTHTLEAALVGRTLHVWADGAPAWHGDVGADALALAGPVGVRSDNGRFDLELRAASNAPAGSCRTSSVDEE